MARLRIQTEGEEPRDVILGDLNTLGRHPSQSIQLLDKLVSKAHATIICRDGVFLVKDVGSRNGTLVNAESLATGRPLSSGDEVTMGSNTCVFEVEE